MLSLTKLFFCLPNIVNQRVNGHEKVVAEVPKGEQCFMYNIILSIHGPHSNGWDVNVVARWSH